MYLFINTVDKSCSSFVIFGGKGEIFFTHEFIDKQEKLIGQLKAFLKKSKIIPKNLKGVLVMSGPGSFTASRAGIVLANSFNFIYKIPVVDAEDRGSGAEEFIKNNLKKLLKAKKSSTAKVYYSRKPNITI
ncbi:hypothetical protein KJ885_00635 [Patescibacteria group bacterium]|nr:hypothetical protein [Patescibacteria group bacterium]